MQRQRYRTLGWDLTLVGVNMVLIPVLLQIYLLLNTGQLSVLLLQFLEIFGSIFGGFYRVSVRIVVKKVLLDAPRSSTSIAI